MGLFICLFVVTQHFAAAVMSAEPPVAADYRQKNKSGQIVTEINVQGNVLEGKGVQLTE